MSFQSRRRFLWVLFLAGIAITTLLVAITNGTTLARLSLEELAHRASAVARVRCLAVQSLWDRNEIWTETQFEVVEREKGLLGGLVTVRTLGGSIGNLHSHVDGVPAFRPEEEVYLFLWGNPGEPYRVLGWSQGTFRIGRDARNATERVSQDSAAMPVYQPETRDFRRDGIRNLPVADFKRRLEKALEQNAP
jgi:hypothetical protein